MKVITLLNTKGGCGKSTTAIHIAHGLALEGKRVLLLDLESRSGGDATQTLYSINKEQTTSIVDVFLKKDIQECVYPVRENLHLVPSHKTLLVVERKLDPSLYENRFVLKDALLSVEQHYDYAVIDCPGAFSVLVENAIMASHTIIVPVRASNFDLDGLEDTVDKLNRFFTNFETVADVKVLPTMLQPNRIVSQNALSYLQKGFGESVVLPPIRDSVRAAEIGAFKRTLFEHCPTHPITHDYKNLSKKILELDGDIKCMTMN